MQEKASVLCVDFKGKSKLIGDYLGGKYGYRNRAKCLPLFLDEPF